MAFENHFKYVHTFLQKTLRPFREEFLRERLDILKSRLHAQNRSQDEHESQKILFFASSSPDRAAPAAGMPRLTF